VYSSLNSPHLPVLSRKARQCEVIAPAVLRRHGTRSTFLPAFSIPSKHSAPSQHAGTSATPISSALNFTMSCVPRVLPLHGSRDTDHVPRKCSHHRQTPHFLALFCTFLHCPKTYLPSFQSTPHSLQKTPGVYTPPNPRIRGTRLKPHGPSLWPYPLCFHIFCTPSPLSPFFSHLFEKGGGVGHNLRVRRYFR
jgi:hypothetical protein